MSASHHSGTAVLGASTSLHDLRDLPLRAVVIHGGMYKTGSSALQNAVALGREHLKEQGWLYPESGLVAEDAIGRRHKPLMSELRKGVAGRAWAELRAEIDAWPGRVLISHENFFSPAVPPHLLAEQLSDRHVVLVAYVRHPGDYLESCYREWVRRWRCTDEPRAFYRRRLGHFDVVSLLSAWQAALGDGQVVLRPYERAALPDGSTVADVAALLGLEGVSPGGGRNETLNTRQTLVHLVANRVGLLASDGRRQVLVGALASAGTIAETLESLPPSAAGDVRADKLSALRSVLTTSVHAQLRLLDDDLLEEVHVRWVAEYQDVLRAQGAADDVLTSSAYGTAQHDPMAHDPAWSDAVELLLT